MSAQPDTLYAVGFRSQDGEGFLALLTTPNRDTARAFYQRDTGKECYVRTPQGREPVVL